MARKRERSFAMFFAVLFLLTASALPISLGYQAWENHHQPKVKEKPVDNSNGQLKGTKLAGFTPLPSIPKLDTQDIKPGNGDAVKASDTITVDYTGALANSGVIFESSKDSGQPATFPLNQVIAGWTQGIPGMKVGGTRRLLIPADLAYGAQAKGDIPANSDLVFDVTLKKIGN